MADPTLYERFLERMAELSDLDAAQAMMAWDQETYMPPGAQQARGLQMATLSAIAHQKFTGDEMAGFLERLQGPDAPESEDARVAVERVVWDFNRATKIPEQLVREIAKAQSDSVAAWTEARPADDFPRFLAHLRTILDLERQRADCLKSSGQSRYDALLEGYERGATSEEIEEIFSELRQAVVPLVQRVAESPRPVSTACIDGKFDPQLQWDFGIEVLKAMGFDFRRGRQDRTAHPFTSGFHPTDVRITTRVHADNFRSALFSTLHEGGHGLYEQGIAPEDWRTPLGGAISLGIHESQSRTWENLVGRGLPFWRCFYPRLQKYFPDRLGSVDLEEFHRAVNEVRPSLIRVEADEVTYSLHIILRFELERDLLEGALDPGDLPEAWRAKMKEYLGLEAPDDKDGCLQDIHWAWGLLGYFPTYTLGNLYSAQFHNQALQDIPDLEEKIADGDLEILADWHREKIHRPGKRRLPGQLVQDITGRPLSARPFIEYLETKFGEIYRLA